MSSKKLTTEEFVHRAKELHGDKYDYSKVEYVNNSVKVCIICPIHGEFWMAPSKHLVGQGCKECVKVRLREKFADTKEHFIEKARKLHGDKYDYSKVEYVNNATKVCIICPEHGEFWMTPANHTSPSTAQGCPKCAIEFVHHQLKKSQDEFIRQAQEIHGGKYDYSKVVYVNNITEVCIVCPEHGDFWMTPVNHVNKGCNCPQCNKHSRRYTQDTIIQAFRAVHGDKYDYSQVNFTNVHTKVCIICPQHGKFWQTPDGHLSGRGCNECKKEKIRQALRISNEEFIKRSKIVHGNRYDYSKVEYKNNAERVCIICPIHGEFWQAPLVHLKGCGCQQCANNSIAEAEVERMLQENNIQYTRQQTWEWLRNDKALTVDFYLTEYNIAIECQGIQHFKPVELFGGEKQLQKQLELDTVKRQKCEENHVNLLYYANYDFDFPYEVINKKEQLLNEIKKYGKTAR